MSVWDETVVSPLTKCKEAAGAALDEDSDEEVMTCLGADTEEPGEITTHELDWYCWRAVVLQG